MADHADDQRRDRASGRRWTWRRLSIALHRDVGYLAVALTIAYGISGLAVNHIADWEPSFVSYQEARELGGPIAGSEDFAYFLQQRPGCFLRVGNGQGQPMLHNAGYDFNDANIPVGAAFWTRLVERWLPVKAG